MALAFGEAGASSVRKGLESHQRLYSANLLEAELRAALAREGVAWHAGLVSAIGWVMPSRRLSVEIRRVLEAGYLRGADLWHVSCALHLHAELVELDFLTLDPHQRDVAARSGLNTPPF